MNHYYELLASHAERNPDKLFLRMDERCLSYRNMLECTDELANALPADLTGDVLVLADDFPGQAATFFALQKKGACPILLHHGLSQEEQEDILQKNSLQGLVRLKEGKSSFQATGLPPQAHEEQDVLGVLSSGSTGTPKVMYRTYGSWADFFPTQNEIFGVTEHTRMFLHGSLSFTGNLNSFLSVLHAGGKVLTSRKMHCRIWEELLRDEAADVIYLVPAKLRLLTDSMRSPIPSVRSVFAGSQLLSEKVLQTLKERFPSAKIFLYYGASELSYITYAICNDPKRDPANLGKPFPGIGLFVRDGLVYVDTPYHVSGIRMPFTVGDTGYLNEDGELIFQGRKSSWVNKGGVKISLPRIETALKELPCIREAAIVCYEDETRGNDLAAFLVKDDTAEEKGIRQAIRKALKPVEVPSRIFFLEEIPLNDRGKVDMAKLSRLLG
ncbi:MAG: AMP-binding protein [Selenomonadaceae bacterium]|nr:AMP-binding protein [Selenomonadaceae bacterium]